jgi:hypothetical protein
MQEREEAIVGISDAHSIMDILDMSMEELGIIHQRAEDALVEGSMLRLFDLSNHDGTTFVASSKHTARFQHYLTTSTGQIITPLSLTDESVKLVYDKLQDLQEILTTHYKSSNHPRIPPAMGHTKAVWKDPAVLFSRGRKEAINKSTPPDAYVNQTLHTDYDPYKVVANTKTRNRANGQYVKPVPYSVILNCTPNHDAIIIGRGLSRTEVIGKDDDGDDMFMELPPPKEIRIPPGYMVAFRGDYVHGGTSYDFNHTRIHLPLYVDGKESTNTTHMEEKRIPPKCLLDDNGKNTNHEVTKSRKRTNH